MRTALAPLEEDRPPFTRHRVVERRRRDFLSILAGALLLAGGLMAYTWIQFEVLQVRYRMADLEQQLATLSKRQTELRLEVARRSDPALVERRAASELGMEELELDHMVFFDLP